MLKMKIQSVIQRHTGWPAGLLWLLSVACAPTRPALLNPGDFRHHVEKFNRMEDENKVNAVSNAESWRWMETNIPLFECPQDNFEEIYYYRWWTYRKHIIDTPKGFGITEFIVPRSYADAYNLISCALGHHIYEGRWLHDRRYIHQNIHLWYRGNEGGRMKKLLNFSSWTADALYNSYKVTGDRAFLLDMLPDLEAEFRQWETDRKTATGLYWQTDVKDGMEESLSGGRREQNARPTINSYMYGNARAISEIALLSGNEALSSTYQSKADTLRELVINKLWNPDNGFFETLKHRGEGPFAQAREAIGYIPWYFHIPRPQHSTAWAQVEQEAGFCAPFGLTTAEMRHPAFRTNGCCQCEWDGAVWPFATSQTLTAMANLLNDYEQQVIGDTTYFKQLERYVESQYYRGRPYIGEYLDEKTGYWLKGDQERSRYYNHSTFNDLIITGLVGLRPRADDVIELNPLLPAGKWDWFCLDNVRYRDHILTIIWDRDGTRYGKGKGLQLWINGKKAAVTDRLERLTAKMNG